MEALWTTVDEYFASQLAPGDDALEHALADSAAAGLPAISVTPLQGKLLALLARITSARRILEVGTLGGYSAIWMARALPAGGQLVSLEIDPAHAAVAERNIERAGVNDRVRVIVAPAATTLTRLTAERAGPFDLVFIDADKENNDAYFRAALALSRPGTIIVVDNVVREGSVIDESSREAAVQGVRRLTALVAAEPRVSATVVQTVGAKGYDGFLMAVVGGGAATDTEGGE